MAQTNYYIGQSTNSAGESEINMCLYVSRDIRLRVGSGIWIDRKRWGKKNDINIPLIQGEERDMLLDKRTKLKTLTDFLENIINTSENKSSSVIYSDYRYYEIMADKTEIPFRTEER